MGHVDHSVICRDFQPGRNGMVCIICKLMTCRNLEIGELSKLIIICSDHLLLMFALGAFLAQNKQNSLFTDCVWEKKCSESQKLGFVRLQNDLPTLLRNLWRMGHLHNGSICCQDFGSFAKILATHETAKRSLHTEKLVIFVGIACTFDIF